MSILTVREVAEWLRVGQMVVYRELTKTVGFKVGGLWRFNSDALRRWSETPVAAVGRRGAN